MKRSVLLALLAVGLSMSMVGCGGSSTLGQDSKVQVELLTSPGTTDFTNLHIIISPLSGTATSVDAASDTQTQAWATDVNDSGLKEIAAPVNELFHSELLFLVLV